MRRRFLQEGPLAFTDVLSTQCLAEILRTIEFRWNDRIFTRLVKLWGFLGQVISADQSCRAAMARLTADRVSRGAQAV